VIDGHLPFASLSREAVFRLNPDIIIQLAPDAKPTDDPASAWQAFDTVPAVTNGRVYLLTGDHTCIPGPRFIQILEDFSQIIGQDD